MDIKFIKKNLSIIIIMTIIITGIMVPRSKATDALEPGKTLLNYTDVDVKTEPGKELRIIMPNYENTVIDKVKIAGKEQALIKDQKAKKLFIMYTGEAGKVTLEFYKQKAKEPFVIRQMEIKKEKDGTYSAVIDPQITYSSETKKDKTFLIRDGSGIKEIIICKRNAKGSYDYSDKNIIFKNVENKETANKTYTDTKLTELGKRAEIKIKKQDEYGYYEIKVTSTSGLIHKREVKVSGKMSSPESGAKNENGFAPSIKIDKTDPDKVTFTIDKSNKVTSAMMYPIINGKISKSAITLNDIKQPGGYVTSFTFTKEGMFRLVLLNKAGEKVASSTDFIISRKNNSDEWRINESPRVTRSSKNDDIQNVKISDGAIKTIKIFIKENGKYNLNKPIYTYENGSVTLTTPNYIDEEKSNYKDYKDKKYICIALRRVSANHRYLIKVTDQAGKDTSKSISDPELTRNKLFFVKKGKASKKSTKSTKPKAAKAQNTNNTDTNGTAPDNTMDPNAVNDTNTNGATTGNTVDPNAVNDTNPNGTAPDNTMDPNTVNDTNTNGATTGNTIDQNTVNSTNQNGATTGNTVDQNTANSANQNETKPEVKVEKPTLKWDNDKKQLIVSIEEKYAKIKKVDLGGLKEYFTKKSSKDYKWVYNTTKLAKDKKNYTVKVTYENGKTAKSNKVTVIMADKKPTITYNKNTKELTVTDKDGIKSAKSVKLSETWKGYFDKGQLKDNNTKMVFKKKKNSSTKMVIKAKVTDKYDRTETTKKSAKVPATKKPKPNPEVNTPKVNTTPPSTPSKKGPTLAWNKRTKILTVTAPSKISKVKFNIDENRKKFKVKNSSGKKWTYELREGVDINTNVTCEVTYGKNKEWTNVKYIKRVNKDTTYTPGVNCITVRDENGIKKENVIVSKGKKSIIDLFAYKTQKNNTHVVIHTINKANYIGKGKGAFLRKNTYNDSYLMIKAKDNAGYSWSASGRMYGSKIKSY